MLLIGASAKAPRSQGHGIYLRVQKAEKGGYVMAKMMAKMINVPKLD